MSRLDENVRYAEEIFEKGHGLCIIGSRAGEFHGKEDALLGGGLFEAMNIC